MVNMEFQLTDEDGSELYLIKIDPSSFPNGSTFLIFDDILNDYVEVQPLGSNTTESYIDDDGFVVITSEEGKDLFFQAPLHYSTPYNGDINLNITVEVTDVGTGGSLSDTLVLANVYTIDVSVAGVAKNQDEPFNVTIITLAEEDEDYHIGKFINLTEVLVDNDGSEQLYLTLTGLPPKVVPFTDYVDPVTGKPCKGSKKSYCPGISPVAGQPGSWSIDPQAIAGLRLPPVNDYSGDQPYKFLQVFASTQEFDQDQSQSVEWEIRIEVSPNVTSDAVGPFNVNVRVTEEENEVEGKGVSLAGLNLTKNLADPDSETVLQYTIDVSDMIADAQIYQLLVDINPPGTVIDTTLLLSYLSGVYTINADGTITVDPANMGGLLFSAALFWDSNIGFRLRAWALIEDRAVYSNGTVIAVTTTRQGQYTINLVGTADVPTVEAADAQGAAESLILMDFGGNSTDTDPALGRNQSESLYYIVSLREFTGIFNLSGWVFVDTQGKPVGFEGGNGTWIFTYEDILSDIYFFSDPYANGTASFTFTSISTEDGTRASNSTDFDIQLTSNQTCNQSSAFLCLDDPPCEPSLDLDNQTGVEDESIELLDWYDTLTINCVESNDTFSVVFENIPSGISLSGEGVYLNEITGKYVVSGEALRSGGVFVSGPAHFAGFYTAQGASVHQIS
jgi:hypothetical protein